MAVVCDDGFLPQTQALSQFPAGWHEDFSVPAVWLSNCRNQQETSQMSGKPICVKTIQTEEDKFKASISKLK